MKSSAISNFFSVVEIRTKLVSVSTLLLATLYVTWRVQFPDLVPFALMWGATLAVDMGTTAFNNYFDFMRGTDNHRDVNEIDKVLVTSGVSPGFALASAFWCFFSAIVLGVIIAFSGNLWVLPVGALCMAVGFLYTGGPYPISRTPFGELFAGGCLGFALFVIACGVWSVPFDSSVAFAALPSTLWIASILTVNNTCDITGDRAAGRKTFSILVGAKGGEIAAITLAEAGLVSAMIAGFYGDLPRFALYTIAAASIPIQMKFMSMHRAGYSHATKGLHMQNILSLFLLFTLALSAGFLLDLIF